MPFKPLLSIATQQRDHLFIAGPQGMTGTKSKTRGSRVITRDHGGGRKDQRLTTVPTVTVVIKDEDHKMLRPQFCKRLGFSCQQIHEFNGRRNEREGTQQAADAFLQALRPT